MVVIGYFSGDILGGGHAVVANPKAGPATSVG
jgi:hypothetical protein